LHFNELKRGGKCLRYRARTPRLCYRYNNDDMIIEFLNFARCDGITAGIPLSQIQENCSFRRKIYRVFLNKLYIFGQSRIERRLIPENLQLSVFINPADRIISRDNDRKRNSGDRGLCTCIRQATCQAGYEQNYECRVFQFDRHICLLCDRQGFSLHLAHQVLDLLREGLVVHRIAS